MRAAAGEAKGGDAVTVTMEPDTAPRTVETPDDLTAAFGEAPDAAALWDRLSYSHRRQFVLWLDGAKRPETRARRVAETVTMLREGRRVN